VRRRASRFVALRQRGGAGHGEDESSVAADFERRMRSCARRAWAGPELIRVLLGRSRLPARLITTFVMLRGDRSLLERRSSWGALRVV